MPFREMEWPKSEEKPTLGVGGVCHGDAVTPMYRSPPHPPPPQCQLVVQPLLLCMLIDTYQKAFTIDILLLEVIDIA